MWLPRRTIRAGAGIILLVAVAAPRVAEARLVVRASVRDGGRGSVTTLGIRTAAADGDAQCDGRCTFARIGMSPRCVRCRLGNGRGANICTPATFESCSSGAPVVVPLVEGKPGRLRLTVAGVRYHLRCRPSIRCRARPTAGGD